MVADGDQMPRWVLDCNVPKMVQLLVDLPRFLGLVLVLQMVQQLWKCLRISLVLVVNVYRISRSRAWNIS